LQASAGSAASEGSEEVVLYLVSELNELMMSAFNVSDVGAQLRMSAAAASSTYPASKRRLSGK
jgi:hypothetical protein